MEHLRELKPKNEGNDKKNVNDMFEQEIIDEITELLSEDKLGISIYVFLLMMNFFTI